MELEILHQDEHLIAINKPHGLLVHRTPMARDAKVFALQMLREQVGRHVFPAHRLDRKTGGVLLFTLSTEALRLTSQLFEEKSIEKRYLAIVRGYTPTDGEIDYALTNEEGKTQEALTKYTTLGHAELTVPFGKHATSRYSLVEVVPETGRMHQIRKHFAHIFHPIIADRPHGCNKQNKLFKTRWDMDTMMLHAHSLSLTHPISGEGVVIKAPIQSEFNRMMSMMGWANL